MTISVVTLFPQIFEPFINSSTIKRAQDKGKVKFNLVDLRNFGIGKHKMVDDRPYGGGAGMVLRVDVIDKAISFVKKKKKGLVILLDPKGEKYNQGRAWELSRLDHLILVCGHYEGFDERIRNLVDYEISIGDYILSGGEVAAMVMVDSVIRLVPGVLKKSEATVFESFRQRRGEQILEYPHYTRPRVYKGRKVPEILLSGNFAKIEKYRISEAKKITLKRRPDLISSPR